MTSDIAVTHEGAVALIELQRGPHNHVDVELMAAVADALEALDQADEVRAVVLASAGRNFCAGADLQRRDGLSSGRAGGVGALYAAAIRLFRTRKPLVAAVQGAAVGAGLGLALACDFRVAAAGAKLTANFVKLGFHPGFGLTATLPRAVGVQAAALLMLTGRRVGAEEALRLGLIDAIAPNEAVRAAAFDLAREIAAAAPLAVEGTRASLRTGLADAVEAAMANELAVQTRLMATADFQEGVRAVAERRDGVFLRR